MKRFPAVDAASKLGTSAAWVTCAGLFLLCVASLFSAGTRAAPAAQAASESTAPKAAESALRAELAALLAAQAAEWSRGDVEAFASVYADDATFVAPSGMTQGRAALIERYRKRYPDRAAMGTLTLAVLEVRAEGDLDASSTTSAGVASVVARWTLTYPDKPAVSGLTLLVFHRLPAGWRIVQDASM